MKYLILILALLVCSSANADGPRVYARSRYANPYYTANPSYLPRSLGWAEFYKNEFATESAPLAKPPRGLLEILVPGTYTIKIPDKGYYGPEPTIGR